MRYLILSDIHSNWEALEAVLADAAGDYDTIVCCGDIVGYGADPNAATDWVRKNVAAVVRGNHDQAASGSAAIEWFNAAATAATLWTRDALDADNLAYLRELPEGPVLVNGFQIVHGSPLDEDEYIVTPGHAAQLYGYLGTAVTFFGHTHLQGGFLVHRNGTRIVERMTPTEREKTEILSDDFANLINPGSVGQPRDGDPRAAYAIYVPEEKLVRYRRISYDIDEAQQKIIDAGLPALLAHRLALGS